MSEESHSPERRFEGFLKQLFLLEGSQILEPDGNRFFDFGLKSQAGATAVVEAKLMRSRVLSVEWVLKALPQLNLLADNRKWTEASPQYQRELFASALPL